jgi:hypothetical protein
MRPRLRRLPARLLPDRLSRAPRDRPGATGLAALASPLDRVQAARTGRCLAPSGADDVPDDRHQQPDQADREHHHECRAADGQRRLPGRGSVQDGGHTDPQAGDGQDQNRPTSPERRLEQVVSSILGLSVASRPLRTPARAAVQNGVGMYRNGRSGST